MNRGIDGRRFLFVTGKGGTGKTTVTATIAQVLASRGKRVLCAMCQAKERLSQILGGPPVGEDIVQLRPGIFAVNMTPDAALQEYGLMVLKVRAVYKAVFDNQLVRAFFRATPGLNEWAMLGKAWYHTTEVLNDGSPRFDVVILDAPSTGHGLDMLRGPKAIVDIAPPGLLRREAVKAWKMFSDPSASGLVVVTLPEEMPVTETFDLLDVVQHELALPIAQVIVNCVVPPLFTPEEREVLLRAVPVNALTPQTQALAIGVRRASRARVQHANIKILQDSLRTPLAHLPYVPGEVTSPDAVAELARHAAVFV